jgi:hypothetical protein
MLRRQHLHKVVVWALAILFVVGLTPHAHKQAFGLVQADVLVVSDVQKTPAIDVIAPVVLQGQEPGTFWCDVVPMTDRADPGVPFLRHKKTGPPMA